MIHAAWRHKDLDERRIAAFFHAPDRILTHGHAVTGADQIHDLLAMPDAMPGANRPADASFPAADGQTRLADPCDDLCAYCRGPETD